MPTPDVILGHYQNHHAPLAFLSSRFVDAQLLWNFLEKEAYAVLCTLTHLQLLSATPSGLDLFTDHNNLVFVLIPSRLSDFSRASTCKELRCAVRLSIYNYVCYNISGGDNVWADFLGRWSAPPTVRRQLFFPSQVSALAAAFVWPKHDEIARAENAASLS